MSSSSNKENVVLDRLFHRGGQQISIRFPPQEDLLKVVRKLPGIKWSRTHNCWYVENKPANLKAIFSAFRGIVWVDGTSLFEKKEIQEIPESKSGSKGKKSKNLPSLTEVGKVKLKTFENKLRSRRYSSNTIRTYLDCLRTFLRFFAEKEINSITNDDLVRFNNEYIMANNYSFSFQNQTVNALKLFYQEVEDRQLDIELIHRPRREHKLPNVLSRDEVKRILESPRNLKHRCMLSLIYACGLRCSELLNLKPHHISSDRGLLIVEQGKGRKDRIVPLSNKILGMLKEYWKAYKPQTWLFEGQKKGERYSSRSLQMVLKQNVKAAGIDKPVTLHWLRHSYATHLLEQGTNLRYIQEILGHKSSKTTEIYTHVTMSSLENIRSPFDDL